MSPNPALHDLDAWDRQLSNVSAIEAQGDLQLAALALKLLRDVTRKASNKPQLFRV